MATRRKYKVQHFRDGGRVLADMPIADDEPAEAGGFPAGILGVATDDRQNPAAADDATGDIQNGAAVADENPLQRALDAQTRAEEMQRQRAQQPLPSALEQHIQKIPNLSEHKRAFLRQFPVLLEDPITQQIFNRHYVEALQSGGFTDDTAALDNHLIAATAREIAQRRQQLEPAHEPARTIEEEVRRLDDEIEANRRSEQPAPIAPPPAQRAPPSIQGRRVPMSAPVSRDVHMTSGQRQSDSNSMTLTAEERDIAHRSYSAPDMTDAQKEYEYAKAKRRMIQMKADGSIQGDR